MTDKVLSKVFLSTTGKGLARAAAGADGLWTVESVLEGRDVRSLAADPSTPASSMPERRERVYYAATIAARPGPQRAWTVRS